MKRRTAVDPRAPWVLGPWVLALVGTGACGNACAPTTDRPVDAAGVVDALEVPEGFVVQVFAEGVTGARSLARSDDGTIFVGSRDAGLVHALTDADGDGRAETVRVIARGLRSPNGVAVHDGDLYVAEISRVSRWEDVQAQLARGDGLLPDPTVVRDDFPTEGHHGWKYIAFGPDGWLYVPVGAPCNVCERDDEIYASITRMRPDGSDREVFAHGVRNTVGFDWDPETGALWFTDNGRDNLGDDRPTDELNFAPEPGLHFGFPYCHQGDLRDPEFGDAGDGCTAYRAPAQKLGPHVAALGMTFYEGAQFPAEYRGQIFVAEHGSWNRSVPIGYRVSLVRRNEAGEAVSYEPFIEGWLQGRDPIGRPVDVLELPDGSLLVSDDFASLVYRVAYEG